MSEHTINQTMAQINRTNTTSPASILVDPGPIYNSYTAKAAPPLAPRKSCFRPLWLLGLSLYILSQVLGSTLALQYMRSEYVAPLGSASLIFNFLFARWLLGTKITTLDAVGTLVVILGVVGVIGFGNIRLKVYDSTLIVPVLFATYTGSGFINSLIYLHELPHYRTTVLLMIWLCMAVLVIGVCITADPEGEAQQTAIGREEAVGMVMITAAHPIKKRRSPSIHSHQPEIGEYQLRHSSESGSVRSAVGQLTKTLRPTPADQHPAHQLFGRAGLGRAALPADNPFDDFEILGDEQLPEERDHPLSGESSGEDEIDGLQDNSDGYFHPPNKPDPPHRYS
ncbi:hypothetical protein PtA15_1A470 [Puccinia triticina]|uniref:EamA domain-containing protein n=1 Tax=Puccinia triticina TaxID=208348 RepID=A0ABY7CAE4_9BASI|nr:uncharacterized protein PtA15_1A470 [Puccinia triticina]WAQ81131.1 hypothetical protein PtA15_1A470 [Puccinia triticina]